MPFFSFTKVFSRVRVAENKAVVSRSVPATRSGEVTTRVHLVPLAQASTSKVIRLNADNLVDITGTGPIEMVADVGLWEALQFEDSASHHRQQLSTRQVPPGHQAIWQPRSFSGSSTATAVSVGSCDSGDTLMDDILAFLGEPPRQKLKAADDSLADIDQAALFDELEALCNPLTQVSASQSVLFAELELLCTEPAPTPAPAAVRSTAARTARRQAHVEGVKF